MTWLNKLSNPFKVALLSLFAVIVVFLGLVFGYFINLQDLPNGLLAGGLLGSLSYLIIGFIERIEEKKHLLVWTVIFTIIRFLLIGGLLFLAALLQYKYGYKVMNVFTVLGGYLISLIVYIIVLVLEKKHV